MIIDEDLPWKKRKDKYYRRHFCPEKDPIITKFAVSVRSRSRTVPGSLEGFAEDLNLILFSVDFFFNGPVVGEVPRQPRHAPPQLRHEGDVPHREPADVLRPFHDQRRPQLPAQPVPGEGRHAGQHVHLDQSGPGLRPISSVYITLVGTNTHEIKYNVFATVLDGARLGVSQWPRPPWWCSGFPVNNGFLSLPSASFRTCRSYLRNPEFTLRHFALVQPRMANKRSSLVTLPRLWVEN